MSDTDANTTGLDAAREALGFIRRHGLPQDEFAAFLPLTDDIEPADLAKLLRAIGFSLQRYTLPDEPAELVTRLTDNVTFAAIELAMMFASDQMSAEAYGRLVERLRVALEVGLATGLLGEHFVEASS